MKKFIVCSLFLACASLFCFVVPHVASAASFTLTNLTEGEVVDASQPYILQGNQDGISDISVYLERIKDVSVCHNNGSDPFFFTKYKLAATSTLSQPIDFSSYKDKLSEKISFKILIRNGITGDVLVQKTIKFKNVPGKDWCDNPEFGVYEFALYNSPGETSDGFASANFQVVMMGVEKIIIDYGDGTVAEFSTKEKSLNGFNFYQHLYKKTDTYTAGIKVYDYKNNLIEKSIKFHAIAIASEPHFFIDSPASGTSIAGGSSFGVKWHSVNLSSDAKVAIGLYKVVGQSTRLVDVFTNTTNKGEATVSMFTGVPDGEYLINLYCTQAPYCYYGKAVNVQKTANIVEQKVNVPPTAVSNTLPSMPVSLPVSVPQTTKVTTQPVVTTQVQVLENKIPTIQPKPAVIQKQVKAKEKTIVVKEVLPTAAIPPKVPIVHPSDPGIFKIIFSFFSRVFTSFP